MRLIDADSLVGKLWKIDADWFKQEERNDTMTNDIHLWRAGLRTGIIETNHAPTIDAVPVVRCKDCKWYQDNTSWENVIDYCKWISTETPDEDDFCSCGERKDNG